jgi:hypothetical protein
MSRLIRVIFDEENLKELLTTGKTVNSTITFILNGQSGYNQVGVSDDDLRDLTTGILVSTNTDNLEVQYILQDIGYTRIYPLMSEYRGKKNG